MPAICKHFIIRELGPAFVNIPPFDFHHACMLSSCQTAINTFLLPDNDEAIVIGITYFLVFFSKCNYYYYLYKKLNYSIKNAYSSCM